MCALFISEITFGKIFFSSGVVYFLTSWNCYLKWAIMSNYIAESAEWNFCSIFFIFFGQSKFVIDKPTWFLCYPQMWSPTEEKRSWNYVYPNLIFRHAHFVTQIAMWQLPPHQRMSRSWRIKLGSDRDGPTQSTVRINERIRCSFQGWANTKLSNNQHYCCQFT